MSLVEIVSQRRGLLRYFQVGTSTVRFLLVHRPRLLIVQSPSLVLVALALVLRPAIQYALVVDAHNEAVEPYLHPSKIVLFATRIMLRLADRVIVSNEPLAAVVRTKGGNPMVLPDPVPLRQGAKRHDSLVGPFRVVVVSTYAADEPFDEIVKAAREAGNGFQFLVTGNPSRLSDATIRSIPTNMTLTGFLSEAAYWDLLVNASVVLDLTKMPNCLVCGAYEALSAGVPVILSNNEASVETFGDFAEFTGNSAAEILAALKRVQARPVGIPSLIEDAREAFEDRWRNHSRPVCTYIHSICSRRTSSRPAASMTS